MGAPSHCGRMHRLRWKDRAGVSGASAKRNHLLRCGSEPLQPEYVADASGAPDFAAGCRKGQDPKERSRIGNQSRSMTYTGDESAMFNQRTTSIWQDASADLLRVCVTCGRPCAWKVHRRAPSRRFWDGLPGSVRFGSCLARSRSRGRAWRRHQRAGHHQAERWCARRIRESCLIGSDCVGARRRSSAPADGSQPRISTTWATAFSGAGRTWGRYPLCNMKNDHPRWSFVPQGAVDTGLSKLGAVLGDDITKPQRRHVTGHAGGPPPRYAGAVLPGVYPPRTLVKVRQILEAVSLAESDPT